MHGGLFKSRCDTCNRPPFRDTNTYDLSVDVPRCDCGGRIRPHICWFGEGPFDNTLSGAGHPPFEEHHKRYREQRDRTSARQMPLEKVSSDNGNLYHSSFSLMLAHEDKSYPGALIGSLSILWGEAAGDKDQGWYHLVWTRDMVNSASALLVSG